MRVIPGILMLLAVSGASANASAAKFDLNSALNGILKVVLDTRQYGNYDEVMVEGSSSNYDDGLYEIVDRSPAVFKCYLDFPGSVSDGANDYAERVPDDGLDWYFNDEYYRDEEKCNRRSEIVAERDAVIYRKKEEENRRKQAEYIAKTPKKIEAKIGMTKDQVKKSRWGNPTTLHSTTNSNGIYEKWGYYNGQSHRATLYFTNGKLTSIERTGVN